MSIPNCNKKNILRTSSNYSLSSYNVYYGYERGIKFSSGYSILNFYNN